MTSVFMKKLFLKKLSNKININTIKKMSKQLPTQQPLPFPTLPTLPTQLDNLKPNDYKYTINKYKDSYVTTSDSASEKSIFLHQKMRF